MQVLQFYHSCSCEIRPTTNDQRPTPTISTRATESLPTWVTTVKLITFLRSGERLAAARAGVLLPYGVVDLQAAAPLVFEEQDTLPLDMLRLLDGSEEGRGVEGAAEIVNAVLDQLGGAVDVVRDEFDPELVDLVLLPPVWERIVNAHREAHRALVTGPDRREGRRERPVPQVKFRWRPATLESPAQPRPSQRHP